MTLDDGSRKQTYVKESDKDYCNNAAENIWENNWWYSPCTSISYGEENYHGRFRGKKIVEDFVKTIANINIITTPLGMLEVTSAEMDEDNSMEFYINVSGTCPEWSDAIKQAIETGKLAHEEVKRYGWTWSSAGVDTLTRLHVLINSEWKIRTGLEVYFQDKEKDYLFGTVYFNIHVTNDVELKEIIVDAIRSRLFQ